MKPAAHPQGTGAARASPARGRRIGLAGALAIGIGGMVGGGIFAVLGEAVALAHGATALAFLAAGAVALLTAYSYTHLAVRFPSQGGTVVFIHRAFGADYLTGTLNLVLWLSYLVTLALYASAFGAYAGALLGGDGPGWRHHFLVTAGIALPVVVNLFDATAVSRTESAVVALKLALLAVVVAAGLPHVQGARVGPATWGTPLSVVAAGMVIFVAYEGFELIANAAEDVRDPGRVLPRAFYGSVLIVIVLYALVALVTVGSLPEARIMAAKDYALAAAARPSLGAAGFTMVGVSALLATLSAINATVYGNARLGLILARDGELPEVLERRAWSEPVWGVLVVGGLSALLANLVDLTAIAILASAGFLLVFTVVNAAAVRLAAETGARRWVSGSGCIAALAALVTLLVDSGTDNPHALAVFTAFLAFALAFEAVYPRLRGRVMRLPHASPPAPQE